MSGVSALFRYQGTSNHGMTAQIMKNDQLIVRLIRHSESLANAGAATDDPSLIDLTNLGYQQALGVVSSFVEPPELIIHSPMLRAALTAKQTMDRFPDVPVRVMDIQEFTYLDPERCKGTTAADRQAWVREYWGRADPQHQDDGWDCVAAIQDRSKPRCESFFDFAGRVQGFVDDLIELSDREQVKRIAVFGHGQHLARTQIVMTRARTDKRYLNKSGMAQIESDMRVFPSLLKDIHLENAGSFYRAWDGERWKKHTPGVTGW